MELLKESVRLAASVYKGESRVMAEGDVVVPDIKPDILKLLQADAVSCVADTRVTDGRLEIEGHIDLTILYVPDRDGERVRSIDAVFDFSHTAESRKIKEDMIAQASSNVVKVEFAAVNSRKVRVKVVVGLDYEVKDIRETELPYEAEGDAEIRSESVKLMSVNDISDHEFELRETLEIPNAQGSVNEILKIDARICGTDYKSVTGKVVIKGEIGVCVLYTNEDMEVEFTEAELPFTEILDSEEITEDTVCELEYDISDIDAVIEEDSDGDRRIISLDITVQAHLNASDAVSLDMISDCFVPGVKTVVEQEEAEIEEIAASPSMQNTIREIVDLSEGNPKVEQVYNVIARANVSKAELRGGKLLCEGKIDAYILYLSQSADNPVYSIKKDIPFSYMMDCDTETEGMEAQLKAEVRHTSYSLNSAGELEMRCILSLSANIIDRRKINVISSVEEAEDSAVNNGIVIYFVQNGDTLWDIAKRYSVSRDEIMDFNSMEEGSEVSIGSRLFIP